MLAQLGLTALAAIACLLVWGMKAGYSALAGGGIGTIASLYMAVRVFGTARGEQSGDLVRRMYIGEALKFGVTIALFVLVLKVLAVTPLALFSTYMATFAVYWFALLVRF